jgi:hypothetical protein
VKAGPIGQISAPTGQTGPVILPVFHPGKESGRFFFIDQQLFWCFNYQFDIELAQKIMFYLFNRFEVDQVLSIDPEKLLL